MRLLGGLTLVPDLEHDLVLYGPLDRADQDCIAPGLALDVEPPSAIPCGEQCGPLDRSTESCADLIQGSDDGPQVADANAVAGPPCLTCNWGTREVKLIFDLLEDPRLHMLSSSSVAIFGVLYDLLADLGNRLPRGSGLPVGAYELVKKAAVCEMFEGPVTRVCR